jgi:hypothetical protein
MHQIAKAYQNKKTDKNDVIHTPKKIASLMIEMCDIKEGQTVLDPCAGSNKVFYNNLPTRSINDYCEITEGIDFFNYNKPIDIIIGNPPYSLWDKWLAKTISLKPIKFAYIFGQLNFTTVRLNKIKSAGYGIAAMHVFKVTHWFGESFCVLFEKGAESLMSLEPATIMCESCGHRCKRVSPNVCGKGAIAPLNPL